MRRRTAFSELPDGANFQWWFPDSGGSIGVKVGAYGFESNGERFPVANIHGCVTWLDAPDDEAPVEPHPMTPDEMLALWRDLHSRDAVAEITWNVPWQAYECVIRTSDLDGYWDKMFSARDPDPLKAFEKAYRAWKEAQGK